MEMCYDGALVMPGSYAVMSEDEMTYVEGGVSLPVKKDYLNKAKCKTVAKKYVKKTGLSQNRIAKEIYAHAFLYYASLGAFIMYGGTISMYTGLAVSVAALVYIRKHANPIDIGGDSQFRVSIYNAIWSCF